MRNAEFGPTGNREFIMDQIRRDRFEIGFPETPNVIDHETFRFIEGDQLFAALNYNTTRTGEVTRLGSVMLRYSLVSPLTSVEQIRQKQDALRELDQNPALRSRLVEYLGHAIRLEQRFFDYFFNYYRIKLSKEESSQPGINYTHGRSDLYEVFNGTRDYLKHLTEGVSVLNPHSEYLQGLVENLRGFRETDVYQFVEDTPYRTLIGLKSRHTKARLTPALHFQPTDNKVAFRTLVAGLGFLSGFVPNITNPEVCVPLSQQCDNWRPFIDVVGGSTLGGLMYWIGIASFGRLLSRWFDNKYFVAPMHQIYFGNQYEVNPEVAQAVESLGLLYELNCLDAYGRNIQGSKTLPEIVDSERHHFVATNMRKPSKVTRNPGFIANSIRLDPDQRITFLTGPNSGGKTELGTTIAQMQLLAQMGGWVPAQHAEISPADMIFYQAPMIKYEDSDDSEVGRFEAEATRLRDTFLKAVNRPRSLIIVDEPLEATTHSKKIDITAEIFKRLMNIGCTVVAITNNSELAKGFEKLGLGQFLHAGFVAGLPTYRFNPGISEDSYPEYILRKIGFTPDDMDAVLKEKGYIQ